MGLVSVPDLDDVQFERAQGRRIELAACRLTKENGRAATFIAMDHHSPQSFYREVERYIDSIPGIVLAEGARSNEKDITDPQSDEAALCNDLCGSARLEVIIKKTMGMDVAYQGDNIRYPPERTDHCDLHVREWVGALRRLGFDFSELRERERERENLLILEEIQRLSEEQRTHFAAIMEREMFQNLDGGVPVAATRNDEIFERVIGPLRETLLLKSIITHTKTNDVIVPWGLLHMRPLIRRLLQSDEWYFDSESLQYFTAYECKFYDPDNPEHLRRGYENVRELDLMTSRADALVKDESSGCTTA